MADNDTNGHIEALVRTFKAIADPTRLRMLYALLEREQRVGELALAVGMSDSATSHQLRHLRALRIVQARKEGRTVHYRIDDDHIRDLLVQALEHQRHH